MNIEEILKQLEDSIKEPVVGGIDYYTGEGWEEPNFVCLDPTTNDCKVLYEYITKLQNNWNELKKWLQEKAIEKKENEEVSLQYFYVHKKMQELEGENNNEEESNSK